MMNKHKENGFRSLLMTFAVFAMSLVSISAMAAPISVVGKVVDANGEPLVGASVVEAGTSNGTITDLDGAFVLSVEPNVTLHVSYVGYKDQEVRAHKDMVVMLKEDTQVLDEVVAIGYGTQKKANLTGAVTTVDVSKTLESKTESDVAKALQGAVPGLTITNATGDLDADPTVVIRGIGTLSNSGTSTPLYIVDGVPMENLGYLNSNDIESISVLKDAASASIYGARGAFGVLLITTKAKAKHERLSVKYTNNFSWRTPTQNPEQLPGWQQAEINLQGEKNAAANPSSVTSYNVVGNMRVDAQHIQKMKEYWEKYGYGDQFGPEMELGRDFEFRDGGMFFIRTWDWYDQYIKDWSPQQNHSLTINGGNGKTNYNVALSYLNQEGMMKVNSDEYTRYNGNFSINSELNKYISVRAGAMLTRSDYDKPFNYNSDLYDQMYYLYRWQPMMPYGTFEGKPFRNAITEQSTAPTMKKQREYVRFNGGLTLRPFEGFTFDADFTYSTVENRFKKHGTPSLTAGYNVFSAITSVDALRTNYTNYVSASSYDYAYQENGRTENLTANFVATYAKKLGDHDFKVMAGSNIEKSEYQYFWAQRKGLLDPMKPELNMATGDQTVGSSHTHWAVAGFFVRINYNFMDRYMLELNGRYDGSSRFPSGQRFGFFPSMSAGWRASEEAFWKPIKPVVSTLKLRGSWGMIGNQDVGTDRFVSTLSTATDSWIINGAKVSSTGMPTIVSSALSWEKVTTLDLGFDARFFNGDFGVTFDWYQRVTSDMHTAGVTLPSTFGASVPKINYGELTATGWELALDYNHKFDNGLGLNVRGSISHVTEEITKWSDKDRSVTGNYLGKKLGEIWGFETEGIFQSEEEVKNHASQAKYETGSFKFGVGDIKYKDLNGDGVINNGDPNNKEHGVGTLENHGDLKVIGNSLPDFEYGITIGLDYKGFDFSTYFQGVGSRDYWAYGNVAIPSGMSALDAIFTHQTDYWTPQNTDAFYPRPTDHNWVSDGQNFKIQDRYLSDMSYLRCKNITLGYSLPKNLLKKIDFQKVRVYFSAENMFTWDNMHLPVDPETTSWKGAWAFGRSYPYMKTISFGVQAVF